jgi:NAD(P)-dependent dehydrogenase (short-subunit alcohol dehydrogenase family)
MQHHVITGANRGIGLELVRQLLGRGDRVEAACRDPDVAPELAKLVEGSKGAARVHRVDVASDAHVANMAAAITDPIDVVINCAGVYGGARQTAADFDFNEAIRTYDVNALGALRVTLALLPHVRRGATKKLVHLTTGMASISDNRMGSFYSYRMSKVALNMMSRSLAIDLRPEGIASYVMNPGWVQTAMGGPSAPTPVDVAVRAMLKEIDSATLRDSGEFLDYKGGRYPW